MGSLRPAVAALVSASLALGGPTLVPMVAWAEAPPPALSVKPPMRGKLAAKLQKIVPSAKSAGGLQPIAMRGPQSARLLPVALQAKPSRGPQPIPRPQPINVRIGQAKTLTHIEFPGSDPLSTRKDGDDLVLRFARTSSPDLVQLKVSPPHFTKAAVITTTSQGLELRLGPASGSTMNVGRADGVTFVNFVGPPEPEDGPADQVPSRRLSAIPGGGSVKLQPVLQGKALQLKFAWSTPIGAAVFRRGDAIWMVFDTKAQIDVSGAPHGLPQLHKVEVVEGKDFSAVRISAPGDIFASVDAQGPTWILTLAPTPSAPPQGVTLNRDDSQGPAALTAQMAGSTGVFWINDPTVGDRLAVVTALAPAKGLDNRRQLVEAVLLPSVQGLAIQPTASDLTVSADGDLVRIGRPKGLDMSFAAAGARHITAAKSDLNLPVAAALPSLIDAQAWSKTGEGGFIKRYDQLMDAAADEAGKGKGGSVQSRMGLARFLAGSGLAFETIGVLNLLAKTNPTMLADAEFRGLRGAARAMAGRYHDAQADLSSPAVSDDPAAALWRGYAAYKLGDIAGARDQFAHGRATIARFAPEWKARFSRIDAEIALAAANTGLARTQLNIAAGEPVSQDEMDAIHLDQARLAELSNQPDQALNLYDTAGASRYGAVAAPALLHAVELRLARGKIAVNEAAATLDSLRYRWRGDGTELETVRALGHLYLAQGRYREALEALRSAGQRSPDQPAALAVANDLQTAFRALFLDGQADGMQPLQALGLFKDFDDLTPIGADGDLMVRKMVRRLVDVDLLDQAADLLKYQVDNRLDGVSKAQVATDLAVIYLMAKKPEQSLQAINDSRTTLLPTALNSQRRVVEARALLELGRADHALELLQGEKTAEAAEVRAEAAWTQHSWPQAGTMLEAGLGDRWKNPAPMNGDEQGRLMRAGVAFSLAGDDASLTRLRTRYGKLADESSSADALRVALAGTQAPTLTAADFSRATSDAAAFGGWVAAMKKHFHDQLSQPLPAPAPYTAPKLAKTATPAAAPPKPAAKPPVKKS